MYRSDLSFVRFATLVVVLGLVFVYVLLAVQSQLVFPGQLSRIEQLRKDVDSQLIKDDLPGNMEDVLGQVTEWNQTTAEAKRYNQYWWSDLLYPDEWNNVDFIKLNK